MTSFTRRKCQRFPLSSSDKSRKGKAVHMEQLYTFASAPKMKARFIVLILQLCVAYVVAKSSCQVISTSENTPEHILDYYWRLSSSSLQWRDYFGIIPHDAVPGGNDELGRTTYIGQVYIKDIGLLPATIYSGCRSASTSAHTMELQSDKNVKILCAPNVSNFVWMATKNEETHPLTNYHFVIGGSEVGHSLNIGRIHYGGETIIGKIFSNPLSNRGLWIPYNGKPVHFLSYEILAYKIQ